MAKVTIEDINQNVAHEYYFTAADKLECAHESLKLLTICVLVTKSGFTVTGESACADPANYNKELGEPIARNNAISKLWAFMGYELKSQLHKEKRTQGDAE
ncbi:MAG: Gp49 family protein [Enterovibrio sp.]